MKISSSVLYIVETLKKISHPSGRPTMAYNEAKNLLEHIQTKFDIDMLLEVVDDIELANNKKSKFSKRQKIELIRELADELRFSKTV